MGRPVLYLAALLCCSLFPVPCSLYAAEPPHVEKFQVGLPGGKGELDSPPYRSGAWAPVYVKIKAGPDGNGRGQFTVRAETTDSEIAVFHYDTPLPALVANQDYIAVAYTRPGNGGSEVAVSLVAADGQAVPAGPAGARRPTGRLSAPPSRLSSRSGRGLARAPPPTWSRTTTRELSLSRTSTTSPTCRIAGTATTRPTSSSSPPAASRSSVAPGRRVGAGAAQGPGRVGAARRPADRLGRRQPPARRRPTRPDAAGRRRPDAAHRLPR